MTPSELYGRCQNFLDMTVGQLPTGPDAPAGFRAFSNEMDRNSIAGIALWEVPVGAENDATLCRLLAETKRLAARGLPMLEQICSTVAEIRRHLFENYTISQ
jgi:hypothetical protein